MSLDTWSNRTSARFITLSPHTCMSGGCGWVVASTRTQRDKSQLGLNELMI